MKLLKTKLKMGETGRVYVNGVEKPQFHPRLTVDKLMLDGLGMMIIFK